jgi:hypothetical protein
VASGIAIWLFNRPLRAAMGGGTASDVAGSH